MPIRFKVLSIVYLLVIALAQSEEGALFQGAGGILGALACLLVLSVVALYPNSSRADRVDRQLSGESWADRVDLERDETRRKSAK